MSTALSFGTKILLIDLKTITKIGPYNSLTREDVRVENNMVMTGHQKRLLDP
jgi:hypothetical protein